ncbi:MAG: hypothetical protein ABSC03_00755 [Verrucomicrobiota bacterium]
MGGPFAIISAECGAPLTDLRSTRAAVFDDLNNDGRIDIVLAVQGVVARLSVYRP